ncbi:MAG: hypothetical protein ACW98U_16995 [Candidatus Thorarchaeota archaeon]|jgi:hypothetical protein
MTFSKCERKAKSVQLSGDVPYRSIIIPLYKSILHFKSTESPPGTARYFDAHLTIPIAVIDAPLIGVMNENDGTILNDLSWVRVYRHTFEKGEKDKFRSSKIYGFDMVHRSFFMDYIEELVVPFSELFSERVLKHQKVLSSGKGSLDTDTMPFDDIALNLL